MSPAAILGCTGRLCLMAQCGILRLHRRNLRRARSLQERTETWSPGHKPSWNHNLLVLQPTRPMNLSRYPQLDQQSTTIAHASLASSSKLRVAAQMAVLANFAIFMSRSSDRDQAKVHVQLPRVLQTICWITWRITKM